MPYDTHTLLLATDQPHRAQFLSDQFAADGFDVLVRDDAPAALRALERQFPDVVVSDLALPGGGGLEIVAAVRAGEQGATRVDPQTPVLLLCDGDHGTDRIRALDRGADDVVGPRLEYAELLARVRAVLRRSGARRRSGLQRIGDLEIDSASRVVTIAGDPLPISAKEFALLCTLASDPGRVFDKEELLREVWGYRSSCRTRTLDSHACRLRRKLRERGAPYVVNVWGIGYRLLDSPVQAPAAGATALLAA